MLGACEVPSMERWWHWRLKGSITVAVTAHKQTISSQHSPCLQGLLGLQA